MNEPAPRAPYLNEVTAWRVSEGPDGITLILARKYSTDDYLLTPEAARKIAAALLEIAPPP